MGMYFYLFPWEYLIVLTSLIDYRVSNTQIHLDLFLASPRDEALFHCAKPSGVLRGPANSTASLICQKHTGKFPKVTGKLLLHKVPMKRPTQQDSHRFCLPLKGSKVPSPLLCCLGGHQGAIRVPFPFPS